MRARIFTREDAKNSGNEWIESDPDFILGVWDGEFSFNYPIYAENPRIFADEMADALIELQKQYSKG